MFFANEVCIIRYYAGDCSASVAKKKKRKKKKIKKIIIRHKACTLNNEQ